MLPSICHLMERSQSCCTAAAQVPDGSGCGAAGRHRRQAGEVAAEGPPLLARFGGSTGAHCMLDIHWHV